MEKLEEYNIPFIDTGMGVYRVGDALGGIMTATTSTPGHRDHVRAGNRITFAEAATSTPTTFRSQI